METNNGKKGGTLKGKSHARGGIKAVVTDTNQQVELEGGEVIINKEASKKHWKELSRINQSAGGGVPILPPDEYGNDDADEYRKGGRTIEFNPNHIPNRSVYKYAKNIKEKYPKVWAVGGNVFGNEAFKNLERVIKRGYWLDSEEWMYVKWQSFNARHRVDTRIAGIIANLKWLNKVDKGWQYMKDLIDEEIAKKYKSEKKEKKGWSFLKKGGVVTYKNKYNKKYGYDSDESHTLKEVAKDTGVSKKGLQQIYNKGIGAYKTNPESVRPNVKSKEQWAMARVYSAVMGGKASKVDANELKMAKGGKTKKKTDKGDCYYIAGQFVMEMFAPEKINFIGEPHLVHAEVQGQGAISHLRYGHAWVEDDVFVYDYSNGRKIVIPKILYYKIGDIKTDKPSKYMKYTFKQARKRMVETGNYGCWDIEVDYKHGGELQKGINAEREHLATAQKLYNREITPSQAPESIAREHLSEDSHYYSKMSKLL